MLKVVKTFSGLEGETYGISVFDPSLETRNGENILCFDEFMLEVVKTFSVLRGEPME